MIPHLDIPFCTYKNSHSEPKEKVILYKSRIFQYSSFKLNEVCRQLRGRSITYALEFVKQCDKKGAGLIKEYLEKFIRLKEAEQEQVRSSNPNYADAIYNPLFKIDQGNWIISECYVGSKKGMKIPMNRAKGNMNIITKSLSRVNIKFKQISKEKFFEQVTLGKADPAFAETVKQYLFLKNAPLSELRELSYITTSRGRHYRKVQFRRLISFLKDKYFKKHGIMISGDVIESYLKKEIGSQYEWFNVRSLYSTVNKFNKLNTDEKTKLLIEDEFYKKIVKRQVPVVESDYEMRQTKYNERLTKL